MSIIIILLCAGLGIKVLEKAADSVEHDFLDIGVRRIFLTNTIQEIGAEKNQGTISGP